MRMEPRANGLSRSPIHLLHRAGQVADIVFGAEMKIDLTPRQLAILITVAAHPGSNQLELCALTGIDRSTLAEIVKRMQKGGLLQRRRTQKDARAYAVKLTDEGDRALRSAVPAFQKVDKRVLEVLPAARRSQFLESLRTIVSELERHMNVAPQT
jgi:MarR family transcriptional regulator, temperature-dependent positive regulator of motility